METSVVKFEESELATAFALNYYSEYGATLSIHERSLIGSIQASGITVGDGGEDVISAIMKCLIDCPPVPYDIVAWRGGEINFCSRPFLSASLLKSVALRYADTKRDLYKIIIYKGSKIFPLRALGCIYGDEEAEIIIATFTCLERFGI